VDTHINRRSPPSHKEHKGRTGKTDLTGLEVGAYGIDPLTW
jgi:hypothetical protein